MGGTTLGIGRTGNRLFETGWSTGELQLRNGTWANQGEYSATGGGPAHCGDNPNLVALIKHAVPCRDGLVPT